MQNYFTEPARPGFVDVEDTPSTPDELVEQIFKLQLQHEPDTDPGDLTIDIQDDMPLVTIHQDSFASYSLPFGVPTAGSTIQSALESHLERIKNAIEHAD